ncbi:hypothetical protein [Auraticoccus monumenti]|uniref:Uncharacterized protein n=1 Tax=Auraticoccus monumenti TaxID=675864 RepID=A0A1G7EEW0_9ACTN|nr:hypothetical protein [Auraticoccus monumenti]SDE61925.1 hypothetical protein SAMN04489747_3917 [Auraticoccus monumenti]
MPAGVVGDAGRRRPVSRVAGAAVLLALLAAVAGFVVMDDRAGGLGYSVALVPVALLVTALGWSGWRSLRDPAASRPTVWFALVRCVVAVLVLAAIALIGLSTDRYEPPRASAADGFCGSVGSQGGGAPRGCASPAPARAH